MRVDLPTATWRLLKRCSGQESDGRKPHDCKMAHEGDAYLCEIADAVVSLLEQNQGKPSFFIRRRTGLKAPDRSMSGESSFRQSCGDAPPGR